MARMPRTDEQERQDYFVELCGGTNKADALERIYKESYPCSHPLDIFKKYTKEDIFRMKAKKAGFTNKQINYFLSL